MERQAVRLRVPMDTQHRAVLVESRPDWPLKPTATKRGLIKSELPRWELLRKCQPRQPECQVKRPSQVLPRACRILMAVPTKARRSLHRDPTLRFQRVCKRRLRRARVLLQTTRISNFQLRQPDRHRHNCQRVRTQHCLPSPSLTILRNRWLQQEVPQNLLLTKEQPRSAHLRLRYPI